MRVQAIRNHGVLGCAIVLAVACGGTGETDGSDDSSAGESGTGGSLSAGSGGNAKGGSGNAGKGGSGGSNATGGKGGAAGSGGSSGSGGSASGAAGQGGEAGSGAAGEGGVAGDPPTLCNPGLLEAPVVNEGGDVVIDGGDAEDGTSWLRISASRYYCGSSVGLVLPEERWVAAIENTGPSQLCDVELNPRLYDASGEELADLGMVKAYAPTHERPDDTDPHYCFGPGEFGYVSAFRLAVSALDAAAIAEVRFTADAAVYSDAVPRAWATLSDIQIVESADGTFARGTATNGAAQIGWWNVRVFLENADGVVVGAVEATDTVLPVAANKVFAFETLLFPGDSSGYVALIEHAGEL
jgi:hypothetical protein